MWMLAGCGPDTSQRASVNAAEKLSVEQIGQLAKALIGYADKHGNFPRDMRSATTPEFNVQPNVMVDPLGQEDGHYSYHAWSGEERAKSDAKNTPLVWGKSSSGKGAVVAYLDGHVEKLENAGDVAVKISAAGGKL